MFELEQNGTGKSNVHFKFMDGTSGPNDMVFKLVHWFRVLVNLLII